MGSWLLSIKKLLHIYGYHNYLYMFSSLSEYLKTTSSWWLFKRMYAIRITITYILCCYPIKHERFSIPGCP